MSTARDGTTGVPPQGRLEQAMSDKSHTQGRNTKKVGKSIKEKRAAKKAKHDAADRQDPVGQIRK